MTVLETRRLGTTDLLLTVVGCGTWAMGGHWLRGWGEQTEERSRATIERAVAAGINWIDTAAVYGDAESVVGRAIEGLSPAPLVATKCGVREVAGALEVDLRPGSIRGEVARSLERLRRDSVDLLQLHAGVEGPELERAWEALAALRDDGVARAVGVSNLDVAQLERVRRVARVDSCQPPYSLLQRGIELDILPYCRRHGIGVIAYSPQAAGILTGAMSRERLATLPRCDWRTRMDTPPYSEPSFTRGLELVEQLRPVAAELGWTVGRLAVAWVVHQRDVTSAIVGLRRPEQVDDAVAAASSRLAPGVVETLNGLRPLLG